MTMVSVPKQLAEATVRANVLPWWAQTTLLPVKAEPLKLKLPLEQVKLMNDIIGKTEEEISSMYGLIDDDPVFFIQLSDKMFASIKVVIPEDGKAYTKVGLLLNSSELQSLQGRCDTEGIIDVYRVRTPNGRLLQIEVEEDPSIQRVGNQFTFNSSTTVPP